MTRGAAAVTASVVAVLLLAGCGPSSDSMRARLTADLLAAHELAADRDAGHVSRTCVAWQTDRADLLTSTLDLIDDDPEYGGMGRPAASAAITDALDALCR